MTDSGVSTEQQRADLLGFLKTIVKPGGNLDQAADEDNLFDASIVDSLAIIQIIVYLEQSHGVNLSAQGIDPTELASIGGILKAIENAPR